MARREQNWITIGFVALGLLVSSLISLPTHLIKLTVLGSELSLSIGTAAQFGILLTALVCLSTDMTVRSHPNLPVRSLGYSITFWILPSVITFSSFLILPQISNWLGRVITIGLVSVLLYLVFSMQYHAMDYSGRRSWPAKLGLQVAVYLAALIFFVVISSSSMRAIISATSVFAVSAMLSLELVRELESKSRRIWLYAIIIGLVMSECKWALNYIKMDARIGGATLLLLYYALTGLTRSMLQKRLNSRVILEYGLVATICSAFLIWVNRWL